MTIQRTLFAISFACLFSAVAQAAFIAPQSWTRGDGGTTYQQWDVFDGLPTDSTPDVGNINPNGTASLTENTGAAILTGGGNIYGPAGPADLTATVPEADVPTPAHDVTAVVQIKTLGTELDYSSVLLNGLMPADTTELSRIALGGFGGDAVESWFLFNVPYADFGDGVPGVEDLTLTFAASGAHMSLDQVAIDTAIRPFGFYGEPTPSSVPEPSTMTILAAAGCAVTLVTRRRRHAVFA